jgi:S-(hydroxymethyl)glutathione dehydrogenase/alcohol dehydrogenase
MAVTDGRGGFTVETGSVGPPGRGEVQVRMLAAGVCHTDYDSLSWGKEMVIGHEGVGTVTAVGEGVTRAREGDLVVLNWAIPCGRCPNCRAGRRHLCSVNSPVTGKGDRGHAHPGATTVRGRPLRRSFHLGTLSEATVVKEEAVVAVSAGLDPAPMAILGCGVMTGFGAAVNVAGVRPGQSAAVIGCGGVGINVIQGCRVAGAARIFALDVKASRLEMAGRFGATDLIEVEPGSTLANAASAIELALGSGVDAAFECTARPELAPAPLQLARDGAIAVQVSGSDQRTAFDGELFFWDKRYVTPLYGGCDPDRDFPMLIQHYQAGRLLLDEQVTGRWRLDQLDEAFAELLHGPGGKQVVVMGEP